MAMQVHFDKEQFETALAQPGVLLVDFWAGWCMPCKMLAPVIDRLAEEYEGRVVVGKVDVDAEPELGGPLPCAEYPERRHFPGRRAGQHPGRRPPLTRRSRRSWRRSWFRPDGIGMNSKKPDAQSVRLFASMGFGFQR